MTFVALCLLPQVTFRMNIVIAMNYGCFETELYANVFSDYLPLNKSRWKNRIKLQTINEEDFWLYNDQQWSLILWSSENKSFLCQGNKIDFTLSFFAYSLYDLCQKKCIFRTFTTVINIHEYNLQSLSTWYKGFYRYTSSFLVLWRLIRYSNVAIDPWVEYCKLWR